MSFPPGDGWRDKAESGLRDGPNPRFAAISRVNPGLIGSFDPAFYPKGRLFLWSWDASLAMV